MRPKHNDEPSSWRPIGSGVLASVIAWVITQVLSGAWPAAKLFLESSTPVANWLIAIAAAGIITPVIYTAWHKASIKKGTSNIAVSAFDTSLPQIEIRHWPAAPYEVSEIQNHHVLSTVRIGLTNPGPRTLSNCRVYVEKISPEPPLPGGLPILLDGANFTLRHDDPEKFIDVAAHWDHVDKFRFSAPVGSVFAEALGYIDSQQERTIVIKVVAIECQQSASFRIWTDNTKAMHLKLIGYVS